MGTLSIKRARTWHYRKMHPCIEPSNGLVPLSLFPSWPGCIINTSGYDFRKGQVVSVGPGGRDEAGKLIPIDLKKGDRVLFGKWSGTEVKIEGVDYLIMKESDIMGVIEQAVARKKAA